MVTTETYSDPRAKEAASEFDDILQVTRTTTCQYSRTRATYTEYGTYTRETVQEAPCPCPLAKASAATQESPPLLLLLEAEVFLHLPIQEEVKREETCRLDGAGT